jgi:hypothetical protein
MRIGISDAAVVENILYDRGLKPWAYRVNDSGVTVLHDNVAFVKALLKERGYDYFPVYETIRL